MLRTTSRSMAALLCLTLFVAALAGMTWSPTTAVAGGGTGIPPPPDDSCGTPDAVQPPGDSASAQTSAGLLYLLVLASLAW